MLQKFTILLFILCVISHNTQCTLFLNVTFKFEKLIVDEKMIKSAKNPLENSEETFPLTLILRKEIYFQHYNAINIRLGVEDSAKDISHLILILS